MNLSLTLTTPATGAAATLLPGAPGQASISPEMASFQDFLAVVGLSPLAVMADEEGLEGDTDETMMADPAATPASETGNFLPPALPVLPVAAGVPEPAQAQASLLDPAMVAQSTPQSVARHPLTDAMAWQGATAEQPASALTLAKQDAAALLSGAAPLIASAPATPAPVQAPALPKGQPQPAVEIELQLPPASAPLPQAASAQAAPPPVLAQLMQAAPPPQTRKAGDDVAAINTPANAAGARAVDAEPTATTIAAPVLPVAAPVLVAATAADLVTSQSQALAAPVANAPTTERHDFTAVVDKLIEARELARPGRADMHLTHREFGQVSVQFELAGQALKVAMSSPDTAFTPAVQAALAERPVTQVADAARADNQPQRSDTVNAAPSSWQAGAQADGQRGEAQQRAQQTRTGNGSVQRQSEGDDSAAARNTARDSGRFA